MTAEADQTSLCGSDDVGEESFRAEVCSGDKYCSQSKLRFSVN